MKKGFAFLPVLVFALGFCLLAACGQSTSPENAVAKQNTQLENLTKSRPVLAWQKTESWPVNTVAFSPDGKILATGREHGEQGTRREHAVKLWDVASGKLLHTFVASSIRALAFSPDGKLLTGVGSGSTIFVWDVATGKVARKIYGQTEYVTVVAFSPDGKTLAIGSLDSSIRLWNVADGKAGRVFTVAEPKKRASLDFNAAHDIEFSPDGKTLAAAYFHGNVVRLWNVETGKLLETLSQMETLAFVLYGVAISPNGDTVACGYSASGFDDIPSKKKTGIVVLVDLKTGEKRSTFESHKYSVNCLEYSPDGSVLMTGGDDGVVNLSDSRTGKVICALYGRNSKGSGYWQKGVNSVAFSPDGKHVAAGSERGLIHLWRSNE